jgi:hypothetical protein
MTLLKDTVAPSLDSTSRSVEMLNGAVDIYPLLQ